METVEPNWYRRERARIEDQLNDEVGEEQAAEFRADFQRQPVTEVDVSPDLQAQLVDRLGAVNERGGLVPFTTMDEPHWPWGMDVSKLGRLPEEIVDLQTDPGLGAVRKLITTTTSGRLPDRIKAALEAKGVSILSTLLA